MKQEDFKKMSRDEQWSVLSKHLEDLKNAVRSRIGVLPHLATLAAALIVVATLNDDLVPLSAHDTKIILTIFMALIPITLHMYIHDLSSGEEKGVKVIEEMLGYKISKDISKKQTLFGKAIAYAPYTSVVIFYVIIAYIILTVWGLV